MSSHRKCNVNDQLFQDTLNRVFVLFKQRGLTKDQLTVDGFHLLKIPPLPFQEPFTVSEIHEVYASYVFIEMKLTFQDNKIDVHAKYYVSEKGVPDLREFKINDISIDPEDVEEDGKTLKKKIMDWLKENEDEIRSAISFAIQFVMEFFKRNS